MTNFAFVKLVAHILLFTFLFVAMGTSVFFFWELSQTRQSMKVQIRENEKAITLNFTKDEFAHLKWTEKNKEFSYQGKMYDVSSVQFSKDMVQIVCDFDKKETGLRKKLNDFFSNRPDKNLPARQLVKVLSQKYFPNSFDGFRRFDTFSMLLPTPYIFCIHSFEKELTGPPPRG